jgi:pyruvate-formate lyase-activating enzyme
MIQGEVASKHNGAIVFAVKKVSKVWRTNRAENAEALVGKKVLVTGRSVDGHPVETVARFIASLQVGETVEIDVAHRDGEALTILELTEDQRERVKQ